MQDASPEMMSLFCAVLERNSSEERAAYLDAACGSDNELRDRIDALLRAHEQAGGFLAEKAEDRDPQATTDEVPIRERPGMVIGPYKLMEQIGEGGMGLVFVAEQQQPVRRKVALKVIKPGMDSRQVVARFEAERQALALMDHPNIARVIDGGQTAEGRPYFVMELVKGTPITEYCDHNQLPIRARLELFVPVCQAVQHAHQKGIIHRDLKPNNVLVMSQDGTPVVKVIDFGVAKAIGQQLSDKTIYTQLTQMVGTPLYMSPEQAGMSNLDVDTRSDIYSLGVLLYELLTGTTPFDKKQLREASYDEIRRIIREEEPPRPSTRISTLGRTAAAVSDNRRSDPKKLGQFMRGELDWIVMKALEKDRNRRYESASAFALDVQRYLHDEPVQAGPPSAAYRLRKFAWRNRAALLTALAIVACLVLALVALAVSTVSIKAERDEKDAALAQARRAERDAQEQLCDSLFLQAHTSRSSRLPGQRFDTLKALAQAGRLARALGRGPADFVMLRNEAIACLALPDVRLDREWEGSPPGTNGLGFDARFERYAWSFKDEGIRVCRVADRQELRRLPTLPAERVSRWLIPRFSPDGRFLAVWYYSWTSQPHMQGPLQVWQLEPPRDRPVLTLAAVTAEPAFCADGRTLAVGTSDGALRLLDLPTGREVQRWPLDLVPGRLAYHPDRRQLAVAGTGRAQVQVCDGPSGRVLYTLPHPARVQAVAWNPAGRLLATGCDDRRIYLWDGQTGAAQGVLEGHGWEVQDLAFAPRGDRLLSFGWDMTLRLWDVATHQQLWHLEDVRAVGFRQGESLGAAGISGSRVRLWTCMPSDVVEALRAPASDRCCEFSPFSPDGRWLVSGDRIWDLAGKREAGRLPARVAAFDGAGNLVFVTDEGRLQRCPVRVVRAEGGDRIRLGPAESLLAADGRCPADFLGWCGTDRRLLVAGILFPAPRAEIQVFTPDGRGKPVWARPVPNGRVVAPSQDGRWLAVGTQDGGRGILVLDARSGELVKELAIGDAFPWFSPDGRWLVATRGRLTTPGGECSLWRTDTWKKVCTRPLQRSTSSPATLSVAPDGSLVAVAYTMSDVRLLDLPGLGEVATLTAHEPGIVLSMSFSPDGRHLVVRMTDALQAWDLRALRRELRAVGLDWDTAP